MPNNNKHSSSSSSANHGGQNKSSRGSSRPSTYGLAKAAGFDNAYHAGLSYGIKMHEPDVYDEVRTILEAVTYADQGSSNSGADSAKK